MPHIPSNILPMYLRGHGCPLGAYTLESLQWLRYTGNKETKQERTGRWPQLHGLSPTASRHDGCMMTLYSQNVARRQHIKIMCAVGASL